MNSMFKYWVGIIFIMSGCFSCSHSEKEEDHEDHHESEGIDIHKLHEFNIETEQIVPSSFHDVIKVSGVIEASNSDIFTVTAKRSGIVSLSPLITPGAAVSVGEKMGSISSEGLQGGDVNLAAAANLQAAQREYERLKPLHEEGLVTTSVFSEAERAYKEAQALIGKTGSGGTSFLNSPISGTIQSLQVKSGDFVEVGSPIATVAKSTNMMLIADLPARHVEHLPELETANFIPEGRDEVFSLKDLNGKKISGSGSVVTRNGYIPIYFSFTGTPLSTPSGYAEVFLICGEKNDVIAVPEEALIEIQGNKYVYVKDEDHGFEKRLVTTGANDGRRVEIIEGLEPGEEIVTKGAAIVRMAEVSSVAPPAHTHNH